MGKYQAYPEYKDTGIDWLPKVPTCWQVLPVKLVLMNKVKDGPHETPVFIEEGVPFLSVDGIQDGKLVFEGCRYISQEDHERYSKKCLPKYGDILLGKAASVGKVAFVDTEQEFNVWSPLAVLTPKTVKFGRFLYYSLQSTWLQAQCDVSSNSNTQKNLSMGVIDNLLFPIPIDDVAEEISNFLDHETAKIDTLIDKQQQLIQLLKEKRQAVISHAVTKGLNPNAPMRDSGVEWLGEVPEHWVTGNLRWFIDIASGEGLSNTEIESIEDEGFEFRVVGGNGTMGFTKKANTTEQAFAVGRVGALCGNVHFIDEPCWITDNALKISSWVNFDNEYLYYLLTAARLNDYASRSAQPLITGEQVKALKCPIPPIHEQVEIGRHIQAELEKFEKLISKNERAMNIAKERRTALISAAVTGKIDVRHHASHPTGDLQSSKSTVHGDL